MCFFEICTSYLVIIRKELKATLSSSFCIRDKQCACSGYLGYLIMYMGRMVKKNVFYLHIEGMGDF